jgi:hypothetical protein
MITDPTKYLGHDLAMHLAQELEVVRPQRARDLHLGRVPVPALPAGRIDGDPFEVCLLDVVTSRVRVRALDDHQAQRSAAGDEVPKRIALAQPGAST